MTKRPRPLVAKGGTSEYIYQGPKNDHVAKRSFDDQEEEEDYLISLFCDIPTSTIIGIVLEGYTRGDPDPIGYAARRIMQYVSDSVAADGVIVDRALLYATVLSSISAEVDYAIKIEGSRI